MSNPIVLRRAPPLGAGPAPRCEGAFLEGDIALTVEGRRAGY